jgi:hypothetical protein
MRSKNNLQGVRSIVSQICSRIARIIRPHKTFFIGFAASLILSQLCLSCTKEDKSTHYLKMIGSCNQQTDIKIFDETGGFDPDRQMVKQLNNQYFKTYVNTISRHVFAKIDKMGQCRGNSQENPQIELAFVYRPAISSGIDSYNDSPTKFWDNRYLDSPWVKLSLDKSPKLKVRAVFFWNERQFLLDQAVIKTRQVSDTKPLLPIDLKTFRQWAVEYTRVEYPQRANIAKQLQFPADIQWLFKYVHSTSLWGGPSEVPMSSLRTTADGEHPGYTELVEIVLDRFFAESKSDIRYDSILDLKDIFNLDRYRIYPFIIEEWFKHYKSSP